MSTQLIVTLGELYIDENGDNHVDYQLLQWSTVDRKFHQVKMYDSKYKVIHNVGKVKWSKGGKYFKVPNLL